MDINGKAAVVTGGASGLGAAAARMLANKGAKVSILDLNEDLGETVAKELDGYFVTCDVTDEQSVQDGLEAATNVHDCARILVNCAGIGNAARMVGKNGPHDFALFSKIITVNLIGTFNVTRLFAVSTTQLNPLEDDERGVIIMTASVAAFDGQIGQAAYSASKGAVAAIQFVCFQSASESVSFPKFPFVRRTELDDTADCKGFGSGWYSDLHRRPWYQIYKSWE